MILDRKKLDKFEKDFARNDNLSLSKKYRILNGMYKEAVYLGVFPLKNPLEGLENDIRLARILNRV